MSSPEFQPLEDPVTPLVVPLVGRDNRGSERWLASLAETGITPLAPPGRADDLAELLRRCRTEAPARPVLLLRCGVSLAPWQIDQLSEGRIDGVVMATSNHHPSLNPFAGLTVPEDHGDPAALVSWLATARRVPSDRMFTHATVVGVAARDALIEAGSTLRQAGAALRDRGLTLSIDDRVFAPDGGRPLNHAQSLAPHETARSPAFGTLAARVTRWIESGAEWPNAHLPDTPATLHVTHSWGGGIKRWVDTWVAADGSGPQWQLRSEAERSGDGPGQRLALYLDGIDDCPVASWPLAPAISDCAITHDGYRAVLEHVVERYQVGRVVVSSLVGHSLDALRTGIPTLQVLHDLFPAWPLLSVDAGRYVSGDSAPDLEAALAEAGDAMEFPDRDADGWRQLTGAWAETVAGGDIPLVAPSQSVVDGLARLVPTLADRPVVVPHGLPPFGERPANAPMPAPRADGRLRLVVPGRIQTVKGRQLLLDAIDRIAPLAQVTLLGAGPDGMDFFGRRGVDVVLNYRRNDLPSLIRSLAPDAALLLSVVPETFSYSLSEMQALGVPVIATRLGALAERVHDGDDGWLIEPSADALVAAVERLDADRAGLERAREALATVEPMTVDRMLAEYSARLPLAATAAKAIPVGPDPQASDWRLADAERRIAEASRNIAALRDEVRDRTRWAQDREHALNQQREATEHYRDEAERMVAEATEARHRADLRTAERDQARMQLEQLTEQHERVLQSASWRVTRPLRVARRLLARARLSGAWKPTRWPTLIHHVIRNARMLGWREALYRLQYFAPAPHTADSVVDDLPGIGNDVTAIHLHPEPEPEVSIVIPVHNKWAYTAACLHSLQDAECDARFEVIVVDDASSDETSERLSEADGIRIVTNDENLGFIGSCNRGAELARGQYLVMLNNDTQVTDGWLDALLEVLREQPDAELVGARLVYPDGTLQEAGGIVFNDGSGWNYGRNGDAAAPDCNMTREVDYCSGACLLLETSRYRQLGGFDPHYAPAYYEDTDLAFRIRDGGGRVYVAPKAVVVHHEGVSSGTDPSHGVKRFQHVNAEKFRQRWSETLLHHPAPIRDPNDRDAVVAARDHHLRGRVLIIDAYTPEPDQDSGSMRLVALMQCFRSLGYGVSFLPDNRAWAGRYTEALQDIGVECWYAPHATGLPAFFEAHGGEYDVVFISRHYIAQPYLPLIRRHCPDARIVFDTVDLHYLREQRLAELQDDAGMRRSAARTKKSELAVIDAADAVVVVSEAEVAVLAEDAPGSHVHVVSNIHAVNGRGAPFDERRDLFFVGGYQHPPNIDAAEWFCADIWPLIRERLPEARFHLVGSRAPEHLRSLAGNGVIYHGFVEDLSPFVDGCRLAVAPLRYGAGVKGKVNLSMSHGQPVVATSVAVEGIHAQHERDALIADDAASFADQVVRLYEDEALWNRLSDAAVDNVRRHFSMDAARAAVRGLLDDIGR